MECCSQRNAETGSYRTLTLCILALFFIDRITKLFAIRYFVNEYVVNSYLYLQLVFNRGISWGILNTMYTPIFIGVTSLVIAITLLFGWYTYTRAKQGYSIGSELLVLVGSLSNILDRFWYGGVVDFIGLQLGSWYFPVFNIADTAVVIGIGMLLIQHILYEK